MCTSHLNINMLDTQKLGLSGEMLALVLEVSVSILGRIRDWLILLWLFSLHPGKHSGSTSNIPRHFRVPCHSNTHPRNFTSLGTIAELRKATVSSSCLSLRPHRKKLGSLWRDFFENLSRKFKFHWNLTRIPSILHEDRYTFMIISLSFLLGMWNDSDKICRENQNTFWVQ
jgi:hypothetical protein